MINQNLIVKNYKRDREENKCYVHVYRDRVLYLITNNVKLKETTKLMWQTR